MRSFLILIFFIYSCFCKGQNLVPNPSFEYFTSCPGSAEFYKLTPWCGLSGGEDALNVCYNLIGPGGFGVPYYQFTGFQYPRTGNGYGSLLLFGGVSSSTTPPNRREYLQVPLKSSLQNGRKYCGTMYINASNECAICTDRVGIYLCATSYSCNQAYPLPQVIPPLNVIPNISNPVGSFITDTLNWLEISGEFISNGNEQYMVIGNFYDDTNTNYINKYPTAIRTLSYINIDDVSLEEVHDAQCINDTTLCSQDSVLLGNNVNEAAEYSWSPSIGLSCTNCPNPKAFVIQTTTYTLTKKQCKVITTDQVTITVKNDCGLVNIPNVFTPNEDGVNDTFVVNLPSGYYFTGLQVYNRWGNVIFEPESTGKTTLFWDGHTTSGEKVSDGTYFYTIKYVNAAGDIQSKKGCISLFR